MSGINRQITPDPRINLFLKHLPNTPQVIRLLRKEGKAYVFNDRETMERVTQAIIEKGERTGIEDETDNYERYGLYFSQSIGYILKADGNQIPLYYAEIKIIKGTDIYHVIPRTKPRRTN
ncbi:DUF6972 family protein [Gloeothece verrucosa]|uniref:DUF6972 domain-containing protein n=1 Tax=Gloeothece verrucosa (strain PCC 7822) TaxID=497965 RepID=E0UBV6_GLOV7|nr:hypothetical protein [Gloeothece verrucosa]ADN15171.1 conserved hypothetical protein [Gloeothece verrucosa PCC 7822]